MLGRLPAFRLAYTGPEVDAVGVQPSVVSLVEETDVFPTVYTTADAVSAVPVATGCLLMLLHR